MARYLEAEEYFKELSNNKDVYFGMGTAKIKNGDIGEAIPIAKKRAREDLAKSIKVKVTQTVENLISAKTATEGGISREKIDENISIKSNSYTDQLLTDVSESKPFPDYPYPRSVSIFVSIKKSAYKNKVDKDINGKKMMIRNSINNGNREFKAKHYVEAIRDWVLANHYLYNFFNGLPIQDDIEGNNIIQNMNAYINGKVTGIFSSIHFVPLSGNLFYDVQGLVTVQPEILAQFIDESGSRNPISNLPLTVQFVDGSGDIPRKITTGIDGRTTVNIKKIDPNFNKAVIRITVQSDLADLNDFPNLNLPFINIHLKKMSTLALAVFYNNNGKFVSSQEIYNKIQSKLLSSGQQIVSADLSKKQLSPIDFNIVNKTHANYLVFVFFKSENASTVGGYENMFISTSSGVLYLYKLPNKRLVFSKQLPSIKGYGVTAAGAGWDGYAKLSAKVLSALDNLTGAIK
jgi:hypothetical protein